MNCPSKELSLGVHIHKKPNFFRYTCAYRKPSNPSPLIKFNMLEMKEN